MEQLLQYGTTGLVALIILAVLVPILKGMLDEQKASRIERGEMRQEHNTYICGVAKQQVDTNAQVASSLEKVREGLDGVCARLNDRT